MEKRPKTFVVSVHKTPGEWKNERKGRKPLVYPCINCHLSKKKKKNKKNTFAEFCSKVNSTVSALLKK